MANFGFFFLYTHFGNNFTRSNFQLEALLSVHIITTLMIFWKNNAMKKNQIKEKKWANQN